MKTPGFNAGNTDINYSDVVGDETANSEGDGKEDSEEGDGCHEEADIEDWVEADGGDDAEDESDEVPSYEADESDPDWDGEEDEESDGKGGLRCGKRRRTRGYGCP